MNLTEAMPLMWALILLLNGGLIYIAILLYKKRKKTPASIEEKQTSHPKYESNSKTNEIQNADKWTLQLLQKIEWRQFERVCDAILQELGLKTETTLRGADGGIDIKTYKEKSIYPDAIVQCKAWEAQQVGIKELREFLGVMTNDKIKEGVFMITHEFKDNAIIFAKNNNIYLHDGKNILNIINKLPPEAQERIYNLATQDDYAKPTCPSCGIKMVLRNKANYEFWGCQNYPKGCNKKFSIKKTPTTPA